MGKYDVHIDMMNRRSSHTLILEQIKPESYVLEMGCYTGYMTKYMKEKLNCCVNVVEIDEQAIECAKPYAYNAFCGDLNSDEWYGYFNLNRYDYILFADVLEHLIDPLTTLTMATELLRKDGNVIISIPNICHNDIIIQLFHDRFTYTDLGLLDCTHIHFWGLTDFARFVESAGLKITRTETVKMPTQGTEQRSQFKVNEDLLRLLKTRQNGEVYQYVFTCEKK